MTKQQQFYEHAVPLHREAHADLWIQPLANYWFAMHSTAMPIVAAEFAHAASEYPIVFAGQGEGLTPVVVLGLGDENNHVDADGSWKGQYIPAFARRYPFVFASVEGGERLVLCIDDRYEGLNREGRGEPLFGESDEPTPVVEKALNFLKEYQRQVTITQAFCHELNTLNLLDTVKVEFNAPQEQQKRSLSGFSILNEERIRQLQGDQLAELMRRGYLDLIYAHLHLIRNLRQIAQHLQEHPTLPA